MKVVRSRAELADSLAELRRHGRVALVPTMGFLHEGHLSLVDRGKEAAESVVVSIFVNPLQFGPTEDLSTYPRDEARDLAALKARGATVVFLPTESEMYPQGLPQVTVSPGPMERRLCGAFRPGHFRGVLTVVAKLFGLIRPDVAVFGRKDYQQAVLIARMCQDLEMDVEVVTGEVVREADGLAMSSRNSYLSPEERRQARGIPAALEHARRTFAEGERHVGPILSAVRRTLAEYPELEPQYVELVDPDTLEPASVATSDSVLAAAVFCGTTRLIDNVVLGA